MKYLIDTHLLIWGASNPEKLLDKARTIMSDSVTLSFFSIVSLWEIAIKTAISGTNLKIEPKIFRDELVMHGFIELGLTVDHISMLTQLPLIHKDPFDRMLVSQAIGEDMILLTRDRRLTGYGDPILLA